MTQKFLFFYILSIPFFSFSAHDLDTYNEFSNLSDSSQLYVEKFMTRYDHSKNSPAHSQKSLPSKQKTAHLLEKHQGTLHQRISKSKRTINPFEIASPDHTFPKQESVIFAQKKQISIPRRETYDRCHKVVPAKPTVQKVNGAVFTKSASAIAIASLAISIKGSKNSTTN